MSSLASYPRTRKAIYKRNPWVMDEGAAKTSDLLLCKKWGCFLAQGPKIAKGLVTTVTLTTHFLINTQTRTLCLLQLDLAARDNFSKTLAKGRPVSKVEHRGPRMKLKPNEHERPLLLRSKYLSTHYLPLKPLVMPALGWAERGSSDISM